MLPLNLTYIFLCISFLRTTLTLSDSSEVGGWITRSLSRDERDQTMDNSVNVWRSFDGTQTSRLPLLASIVVDPILYDWEYKRGYVLPKLSRGPLLLRRFWRTGWSLLVVSFLFIYLSFFLPRNFASPTTRTIEFVSCFRNLFFEFSFSNFRPRLRDIRYEETTTNRTTVFFKT